MYSRHVGTTVAACLVAALCVPGRGAAPQGLPSLARAPEATLPESFSDIAGVRVLRDGRVLVLDVKEQRLVVANFQTGHVEQVGRVGRGPREYARAVRLLALPADTTWLVDLGQRRILLLVGSDIVGIVPAFAGAAADSGLSPASLRGGDARGFVYFTGRGVAASERGVAPADSVMLFAAARSGGAPEPLGRLAQAAAQITVRNGTGASGSVSIVRVPFVVGDEVLVEPDGDVAVVRRAPYRLDVMRRGRAELHGPEMRIAPVPITSEDRAQYRATLPKAAAQSVDGVPWPSHKPPFVTRTLLSAPDGTRWVMRSGRAGATMATYDVFDAEGRPVGQREVPSSLKVLWVGESTALVVRTDEDGLQYLERFRLSR